MPLITLFFITTNLIAGSFIVKFLKTKKMTHDDYVGLLGSLIVNMLLVGFYGNFVKINLGIDYILFVIAGIGGLYGILQLTNNVLKPMMQLRRRLSKEERLKIEIRYRDLMIAIMIYASSVVSIIALYVKNL